MGIPIGLTGQPGGPAAATFSRGAYGPPLQAMATAPQIMPARTAPPLLPAPILTSPVLISPPSTPRALPKLLTAFQSPGGYPAELYVLANGHRVLLEHRPTDLVSLRTFINAGSINENPIYQSSLYGQTGFPSGIAHLDEHYHFLSTRAFPQKNSWVWTVENLGASTNASTGHEMIQHELLFNREDLPAMLRLHGDQVMSPLYRPDDLYQEQRNVLNEGAERTAKPMAKIYNKSWELLFERPVFQTLGSEADVQRTTAHDLQRYFNTFYTPTNMLTVLSGNVDAPKVLAAMDREFGANPPRHRPDNQAAVQLALRPGEVRYSTVTHPQLTYSVVHLSFPAPPKINLKERVAMEFLLTTLAGDALSPLQNILQDQWNLVSAVDVDYMPMKTTGVTEVMLHTQPGQEQKALAATLGLVGQLATQPITPEKLAEIQNRLLYGFRRSLNDVEEASYVMGSEALTHSLNYYLQYEALVKSITAADLMQVAQKYLNPSTYAVVFGLPGATEWHSPNGSNLQGVYV